MLLALYECDPIEPLPGEAIIIWAEEIIVRLDGGFQQLAKTKSTGEKHQLLLIGPTLEASTGWSR